MKHMHKATGEIVDVRDRSEADVAFNDSTGSRHMEPEEFDATYEPIPMTALVAEEIMNGMTTIDTRRGRKTVKGIEDMILSTHPKDVLERAASFIAGFEGDELQEGIEELLRDIRAAVQRLN